MPSCSDFSFRIVSSCTKALRVDNLREKLEGNGHLNFLSEREENVKADIFAAYITLLRQTRPVASQTLDADAMEDDTG